MTLTMSTTTIDELRDAANEAAQQIELLRREDAATARAYDLALDGGDGPGAVAAKHRREEIALSITAAKIAAAKHAVALADAEYHAAEEAFQATEVQALVELDARDQAAIAYQAAGERFQMFMRERSFIEMRRDAARQARDGARQALTQMRDGAR